MGEMQFASSIACMDWFITGNKQAHLGHPRGHHIPQHLLEEALLVHVVG